MKILTLSLLLLAPIKPLIAALPPEYQNEKDLEVMMKFIRQHTAVASTLTSINLSKYTIHFDDSCEVVFHRNTLNKPRDWEGPAGPLEFKSATCPID
jgi:hypothetical protein